MEIRKTKQLWGKKFDVVKEGLAEEQVTAFVNEILKQHDTLVQLMASVQNLLNQARELEAEWRSKIIESRKSTASPLEGMEALVARMAQQRLTAPLPGPKEVKDSIVDEVVIEEPPVLGKGKPGPVPPVEDGIKPLPQKPTEQVVVGNDKSGKQKADVPPTEEGSGDNYSGEIDLVLEPRLDLVLVSDIHKCLEGTGELEIVRSGGSWERGTTITVLVGKAIPLTKILSRIPSVEVEGERSSDEDVFNRELGVPGAGMDRIIRKIQIRSKAN